MKRLVAVLIGAFLLALVPAGAAFAHPLGNFTVNSADRLEITAEGVQVLHVVDTAEIPTVQLAQARRGFDKDGDGALSAPELDGYAAAECPRIAAALELRVDGKPRTLEVVQARGSTRPGAAGLPITRLECLLRSEGRPTSTVDFVDPLAPDRNGWREVTAVSACGPLRSSSVPTDSASDLLQTYPAELLSSPLDVTSAQLQVDPSAGCGAAAAALPSRDEVSPRGLDRVSQTFTDFLARPDFTIGFAVVSVLASVLFGVLHALAPGHGKTVMAAYLVGQRGTRRQALQLGAIVTFTHTASVLLLGGVLALGALAAPELVVPATEVLSGVLLALVGVYLGVLAVRRLRREPDHEHDHEHPHDHDHPHVHPHGHPQGDEDEPPHEHDRTPAPVVGGGGLAVAARPVAHSHGGRAHTHAPLPDGPLSWKALAGMGVAGGLVPSPSALLVLLSATALGRAWFGVVLVVVYGLGMAITLTAAGLLLVRAQAGLDRRGWSTGRLSRGVRLIPLLAAGVVLALGIVLALRGLRIGSGLL